MAELEVYDDISALAAGAAKEAYRALTTAIERKGHATWVLAGGNSPLAAYKVIAERYKDNLDWSKVSLLLGDERCGLTGPGDSNWALVEQFLLAPLALPDNQQLKPNYCLDAEAAAADYAIQLTRLPGGDDGAPLLDHVWLGLGEDGHTLSLFPGQTALNANALVAPIFSSPKPPPERLSLTLKALTNVGSAIVLVSGQAKKAALKRALEGDQSLPITKVTNVIESNGGQIKWLVDKSTT